MLEIKDIETGFAGLFLTLRRGVTQRNAERYYSGSNFTHFLSSAELRETPRLCVKKQAAAGRLNPTHTFF